MIKLIAFDLDGTLLDEQKNISERTKNVLAEAVRRNIFIVPVTGRPYRAIPKVVMDIPGIRYVAAVSGASIMDVEADREIYSDLIPNDLACELLEGLDRAGFLPMAIFEGGGYVSRANFQRAVDMAADENGREYIRRHRMVVDDLAEIVRERGIGLEKFTVNLPYDDKGDLIGVEEALAFLEPYADRLHMVYGGKINLEVTGKNADKGHALDFLGQYLGIKKEEMIGFGDSGNDLDMKGHVGIFAAVANATPEIKAAADYVTASNEESGVAEAIVRLAF